MRIVGAQLYRYSLPLAQPLSLRGCEVRARDGVLVALRSDGGAMGWGDVAPLPAYSAESVADVAGELAGFVEQLREKEILCDADAAYGSPWSESGALSPSAACGLETALLALVASRESGDSDLAGFPAPVRVNGLLSGNRDRVLHDLHYLLEAGYGTLKLKLGRQSLVDDVELTRAVRGLAGDRAALRLDANRAWSLRDAVRFGQEVGADGIQYLEEPLVDPSELPALFEATGIPIALDETLSDLDPEELQGRDDVCAIVLKPTLLGGPCRTRRWADKAMALDMMPVISSSFETGVGILGLARLASSLGCPEVAVGLDTYRWLGQDVIKPALRFARGALEPTPEEGRYEIDFALLREIAYA